MNRNAINGSATPTFFLGTTLLKAGAGGIARVARMTARSILGRSPGSECYSFLGEKGDLEGYPDAESAEGRRLTFFLRTQAAMRQHSHFIYDAVGVARAHMALGRPNPYMVWIHGVEVWDGLRLGRKRALMGATKVLVNSDFTLERFRSIHGSTLNAETCWLATEADDPPQRMPTRQGRPTVLMIGTISHDRNQKGHSELVEAWDVVAKAVPDAQLVLVGGGSGHTALVDLVQRSRVRQSIRVCGFVSEKDIAKLWQDAHVYCMPSRKEGFGIVYAEAMRFGLPVVASIHDAGREVNVDGVTGFNVDLDVREQLADRLIHLLRDADAAVAMGRAGYERWDQLYRYCRFDERLCKIADGFAPGWRKTAT